LSERELEVLTLLADGAANAHIAKQLYLIVERVQVALTID